jgi:peptide/nickel transport system substrate-binding protein
VIAGIFAAASPTSASASTSGAYASETLKVGVPELPPLGGDPFAGAESPQSYTLSAIYNTLTTINPTTGVVDPSLATSWKQTSPTTWVFHLRHGVTFSDGEAFNANAVVTALNYVSTNATGKTSSVGEVFAPLVSAVTAAGAYTVDITTSSPVVILPEDMDQLYIPAPAVFNKVGETGLKTDPVGTGPFEATNIGETEITLKAFTGSWQAPKVGAVDITALPTSASRLQALQSGQIQMAVSLDPDQVSQLSSSSDHAIVQQVGQVLSLALINTVAGPLQNQKVRQALNYAVNREALGKDLLLGKGEPAGQGATPGTLGYNPAVKPYPYDPTKAKALLKEAGYPSGFDMTADVIVGSFPNDGAIYQAMAADFDAIGVHTTLDEIPFSTWLTAYLGGNWSPATAFGLSWNSLFTNDITLSMDSFTCLKTPAFFCDKPTANLLTAAQSVDSLKERGAKIEQVAAAMAKNPPAVFLVSEIDINAVSNKLVGFENLRRSFPYNEMYIKQ